MTWGIARNGTRGVVLAELDMLRDTAKQGKDSTEQAQIDAATAMARATILLAGSPRVATNGAAPVRTMAPNADEYGVALNMSGHVTDDGSSMLYMSISSRAPEAVASLAEGPTPNELAAREAAGAIEASVPTPAPATEPGP